jgi:Platelet-activating factor acetylhydrolase, isoform II
MRASVTSSPSSKRTSNSNVPIESKYIENSSDIRGSIHDSQSDVPCLLPRLIRRFEYPSAIDPLLATQLSNRLALLYLRGQLGNTHFQRDAEHVNLRPANTRLSAG